MFASAFAALAAALLLGGGSAQAAFPGDNGKIAFTSTRDGNFEIYVMNAEGTGQTRLTTDPASDETPAFSPDGTKIVFSRHDPGVSRQIYLMNADGSGETNLTNDTSKLDFSPSFSPDGSKIVFARGPFGGDDIYIMNSDGTGVTQLTTDPAQDREPAFSPDGTKIAFTSERDTNEEIYVMNADGTGQTRLTNNAADDFGPAFSPDGTKIAFTSERDTNEEIYVMNVDGTGQTRHTTNSAFDRDPAFSPDGTKLAFASSRDGDFEVYSMSPGGATRLTNAAGNDSQPNWGVAVASSGGGGGTSPPPPGDDPPPPDTTDPELSLDYEPVQELRRKLHLSASCDEPCAVVAESKLKTAIKKDGKLVRANYTVRQDGTKLDSADETADLVLVMTKKGRKKAGNALAQGGKAKVKGVVTATDESFNVTKQRFKIKFG